MGAKQGGTPGEGGGGRGHERVKWPTQPRYNKREGGGKGGRGTKGKEKGEKGNKGEGKGGKEEGGTTPQLHSSHTSTILLPYMDYTGHVLQLY
jgi:hypothetical protein